MKDKIEEIFSYSNLLNIRLPISGRSTKKSARNRFSFPLFACLLSQKIEVINEKRLSLDTIEALYRGLTRADTLRPELHKLFRRLKGMGKVTVKP